ncbi:nucleoside/nucleotide kinase family protein [Actinotalea sp. M2MS4P-6]|uniref:nucleoside/nucleotide kinase family protein n=1 Tax=Actinotalea sp. M2MS4P-6 TaxID=2983762 RepID=UPI0021E3BDDF|nr:nucleoside/nucleotide kinase family protein [Actinotalea sp. M2MS4P-6]MCV2395520.1 nucleoside/nucleotide kinase family protein [Actinotalea sp. M2MS4P-6]
MTAPADGADLDAELLARAAVLAGGGRTLLGIAGPPGAGKSTLAHAVVAALGGRAVLVPMDGFHLAQAELERLGRADRKGAPDTFDAEGFVALLTRLGGQRPDDPVVYAPRFDRLLEEAIAGAIPVPGDVPLVVVEGNYLLHDDGAWGKVASLLDETWYLELDDEVRVERLVARHVAHGRSPAAAREWVLRSDEANARLVAAGRGRASRVVRR